MLLVRRAASATAVVEDDGEGFTATDEAEGGIGLAGMRERLALLGGRLTIESDRGDGDDGRCRGAAAVIRVLVVDDHAVVRSGLKLLLAAEDDLEVVGEAGTAREAVFEVRAAQAGRRPARRRHAGRERDRGAAEAPHESPETKVLVLSMQDDPNYVREAFAAGASGYVLKEAADAEVVEAIRQVAGGGSYVHRCSARGMVAAEPGEGGGGGRSAVRTASARC